MFSTVVLPKLLLLFLYMGSRRFLELRCSWSGFLNNLSEFSINDVNSFVCDRLDIDGSVSGLCSSWIDVASVAGIDGCSGGEPDVISGMWSEVLENKGRGRSSIIGL
jgi:hypothetical protein